MIYCVVPEALEEELFDKLTAYYADDASVTVIVDRRRGDRRNRRSAESADPARPDPARPDPGGAQQRERRDRRRARVPGDFPPIDRK